VLVDICICATNKAQHTRHALLQGSCLHLLLRRPLCMRQQRPQLHLLLRLLQQLLM